MPGNGRRLERRDWSAVVRTSEHRPRPHDGAGGVDIPTMTTLTSAISVRPSKKRGAATKNSGSSIAVGHDVLTQINNDDLLSLRG